MIIPFQDDSTVNYAGDIACCCVFCLDIVVQMVQVSTCRVLDSEIIDDESEKKVGCFVSEKSIFVFDLYIGKCEEVTSKLFVCQNIHL